MTRRGRPLVRADARLGAERRVYGCKGRRAKAAGRGARTASCGPLGRAQPRAWGRRGQEHHRHLLATANMRQQNSGKVTRPLASAGGLLEWGQETGSKISLNEKGRTKEHIFGSAS